MQLSLPRIELRLYPDEAERVLKALQAIRQELIAGATNPIDAAAAAPSAHEGPAQDDDALGFTDAFTPAELGPAMSDASAEASQPAIAKCASYPRPSYRRAETSPRAGHVGWVHVPSPRRRRERASTRGLNERRPPFCA
jgi:hypothetical protein